MRQQHAIGNIGDLVTALGLVHVMGGDQDGEALRRARVNLVLECAPRLRTDACRRLVRKKELRVRKGAGTERKPLLPAPGKLARELALAGPEPTALGHRRR